MFPAEGEKKKIELLREFSEEKRIKISFTLTRLVNRIMEDGIRSQYPDISPQEFKKQVAIRLGR